jgi:hypothetical protein
MGRTCATRSRRARACFPSSTCRGTYSRNHGIEDAAPLLYNTIGLFGAWELSTEYGTICARDDFRRAPLLMKRKTQFHQVS